VFALVLASTIVLDVYIPPLPFDIVFGAPQVLYALYRLVQALYRGSQKKRWTGYATLLATCIVTDFEVPGAQNTKKFIHYGQNVGLTAFLPPLYLFVIWMQTEPPLLSNSRLLSWRRRLFTVRLLSPRRKAKILKIQHIRLIMAVLRLFGTLAINSMLSYFLPGLIYSVATSIPFALYAVDKFMTSWQETKDIAYLWFLFVVVGVSITLQFLTFGNIIGISGLGPSLYLWIYHNRHEIRAWWVRYGSGLIGTPEGTT